jgi:hypothetical protein
MLLAACQGCRNPIPSSEAEVDISKPTVRLYLMSNLAGALEPCGCSKDQLGGVDHLAAFIQAEASDAPNSLVLAAGPLLFIEPTLEDVHATQDTWKAESIAEVMKDVGLAAWAPGFNDWAAGREALANNANTAGAIPLGAGLGAPMQDSRIFEVGGLRVGVFGITDPRDPSGRYPDGVGAVDASQLVTKAKQQADALTKQGAQLLVALTALQRGQALRIADALPSLHLLVIGKQSSAGHANTQQPPAELVGPTLVVETANHAQTIAIVDVFVRDKEATPLMLADAGGVQKAAKVVDLSRRIRELEVRINNWEKGGKVDAKDLAGRKLDLARLRKQREALDGDATPPTGSFFRYHVEEVREGLGKADAVAKRMRTYYKRVNEHNKKALADMKPPTVTKGQAAYVGDDECELCHAEEQEVWQKTPHAKAYKTLADDFKEYNLDCVGCHVTGYGKAGGSTVTHNDKLRDVQCETCHGPGSLHVAEPEEPKLILLKPDPNSCVEQCHHPPHVEGFDPKAKMELILGPGHGKDG